MLAEAQGSPASGRGQAHLGLRPSGPLRIFEETLPPSKIHFERKVDSAGLSPLQAVPGHQQKLEVLVVLCCWPRGSSLWFGCDPRSVSRSTAACPRLIVISPAVSVESLNPM